MIIILVSIIIILIISFGIMYMVQIKRIKELRENIDFILNEDTNMELTTSSFNKDVKEVASSINKLIKKNKDDNIKLRKVQKSLKTTLVSISHDIRTPLTSISGYIQLLEREELERDKRLEYIDVIKSRTSTVQKMLDLLFEFIRLENGDMSLDIEKVNVDDVLRDTLAMYYCDFSKKLGDKEPVIIVPDKNISIRADKNALARVFNNIVYNSLIHGDNYYRIELREEETKVSVSFANSTSSIKNDDISYVFDRFFTGDKSKSKKTTGLGLSISKILVEKMGGKISADINDNIFEIKIDFEKI